MTFDETFCRQLDCLFRWRRDVRHFLPDPIAPAVLDDLLRLAASAPSVGLSQPWRFVLVDDAARRRAVEMDFARCNAAALARQQGERAAHYAALKLAGLREAPCHLAVCLEPDPAQGRGLGRATMPETAAYSAVLAVHTLWLAARARGVGVGWVSILDPAAVLAALDVPAAWRLVAYLCLGTPAANSEVPELEREGWETRRDAVVLQR